MLEVSFIQTSNVKFRKYNNKWPKNYISEMHVIKISNRLVTRDYGQQWLVLNPFPNNLHEMIKY